MKPVLIFGASARAAAQSAIRAGMRPICSDLFADLDLREMAEVLPAVRYPHDLPQIAERVPTGPWMYTGALENYPEIISAVSSQHRLWGNPVEVVDRVRDPFLVYALLHNAGLPAVDVRRQSKPPPADGSWMIKPIRSAGGRGIRVWNEAAAGAGALDEPHYFQQKLDGTSISALFLATALRSRLVGITRQFVGTKMLHAPRFGYCGSIGPLDLPTQIVRKIKRMGQELTDACRLRGLFGIDLVCDGKSARLTEVNPRYTASVEVLENALRLPMLGWHGRTCEAFADPQAASRLDDQLSSLCEQKQRDRFNRTAGKAILYASRNLDIPQFDGSAIPPISGLWPHLADIPSPGSLILAGRPICTILAEGSCRRKCLKQLVETIRMVRTYISTHSYS